MLDDQEFAAVWRQYQDDVRASATPSTSGATPVASFQRSQNTSLVHNHRTGVGKREVLYRPLSDAFEKVVGVKFDGTDAKVLLHYRVSFYGPPCPYCGKLLRHTHAKQCFECSMDWHDPEKVVRRK